MGVGKVSCLPVSLLLPYCKSEVTQIGIIPLKMEGTGLPLMPARAHC